MGRKGLKGSYRMTLGVPRRVLNSGDMLQGWVGLSDLYEIDSDVKYTVLFFLFEIVQFPMFLRRSVVMLLIPLIRMQAHCQWPSIHATITSKLPAICPCETCFINDQTMLNQNVIMTSLFGFFRSVSGRIKILTCIRYSSYSK